MKSKTITNKVNRKRLLAGRCESCKHWTRLTYDNKPQSNGDCQSEKFVYGSECPSDGLEYWDYESYLAGFKTGEKFGCIHWQPANAKKT